MSLSPGSASPWHGSRSRLTPLADISAASADQVVGFDVRNHPVWSAVVAMPRSSRQSRYFRRRPPPPSA
jgi:hypothetical protein